jgi:Holliday junction DNA helicase RuvA
MIAHLVGTVRFVALDKVIVDVGGVGLAVSVSASTSAHINVGAPVQLFTSLVVREDSLTLFGFLDEESRTTFELLQTVSGIGPKVALAIMGAHSPQSLAGAIAREDVGAIEKVPGIGKKGAQRLILELKGKISDFGSSHSVMSHQPAWREQLLAALTSLGFSAKDADVAISEVLLDRESKSSELSETDLPELLKQALQKGRRS